MEGLRYTAIGLVLRALAASRLDRALAPLTRGRGAILTIHRVTDDAPPLLPENAGLSITPAYLDAALNEIRRLGYQIVALDELSARLAAPDGPPFVVLTFDDGYRDTRDCALPVLEAHGAPFTTFICTGFAARTAPLWWLDLEDVAARLDSFEIALPTGGFAAPAHTVDDKRLALRALYWRLRELDETSFRAAVASLCAEAQVDPLARVDALCMSWDEIRAFAAHPLVSLGAHSLSHPRLGFLPEAAARDEMAQSRDWIAHETGVTPRHFCYPVGDARSAGAREGALARELGYACGLTTRPGVLRAGADLHLLPRISLNGLFQSTDALRVLLSGIPFLGR